MATSSTYASVFLTSSQLGRLFPKCGRPWLKFYQVRRSYFDPDLRLFVAELEQCASLRMPQIYVPFTIHYWTWDRGPLMTVDQTCPVFIPRNFLAPSAFRWGMAVENSGVWWTLMLIGGFGATSLRPLPETSRSCRHRRTKVRNHELQYATGKLSCCCGSECLAVSSMKA